MLQSLGSQRIGHDLATEQQQENGNTRLLSPLVITDDSAHKGHQLYSSTYNIVIKASSIDSETREHEFKTHLVEILMEAVGLP